MLPNQQYIAGIDEAGRGSWAGPVVAAVVAFPWEKAPSWTHDLDDSKLLSEKKRDQLFSHIISETIWSYGFASHDEIDLYGIKKANHTAMLRACIPHLNVLKKVIVDGNDGYRFPIPHESLIHGDSLIPEISAASIVAKVIRDKMLAEFHMYFPDYGFQTNKGYGTKEHQRQLAIHGPCMIHRKSYEPIRMLLI